jgi:hypothetical protein
MLSDTIDPVFPFGVATKLNFYRANAGAPRYDGVVVRDICEPPQGWTVCGTLFRSTGRLIFRCPSRARAGSNEPDDSETLKLSIIVKYMRGSVDLGTAVAGMANKRSGPGFSRSQNKERGTHD